MKTSKGISRGQQVGEIIISCSKSLKIKCFCQGSISFYSTTLNCGVLPLVKMDHVTQ